MKKIFLSLLFFVYGMNAGHYSDENKLLHDLGIEIMFGNTKEVYRLLEQGVNPNAVYPSWRPFLDQAANTYFYMTTSYPTMRYNTDILDALVAYGADLDAEYNCYDEWSDSLKKRGLKQRGTLLRDCFIACMYGGLECHGGKGWDGEDCKYDDLAIQIPTVMSWLLAHGANPHAISERDIEVVRAYIKPYHKYWVELFIQELERAKENYPMLARKAQQKRICGTLMRLSKRQLPQHVQVMAP